jgi:hypothetical protein
VPVWRSCTLCSKIYRGGSPGHSGDKQDDIAAYRYELASVPFVIQRPCHLAWDGPQAGVRWYGAFRVVKTAQSRGRTERTLLQRFRNYCGAIKVARCGFPWEKPRKGQSLRFAPIAKLLRVDFCSSQLGETGVSDLASCCLGVAMLPTNLAILVAMAAIKSGFLHRLLFGCLSVAPHSGSVLCSTCGLWILSRFLEAVRVEV